MKFNIVPTRSDTIGVSASYYDCPSKNAFTLKRVDGDLKWLQYKTRPRDSKKQIWMGGDYGLIHVDHPGDLFSFDKEQIEELNQLDTSQRLAKKSENKIKIERKIHDLLFSLRSQMRGFISKEIKKLDVSGECLISSDYWTYPTRQKNLEPECLWPGNQRVPSIKDSSPFLATTRFGMAFFQFNTQEDGIKYIEEWIDYTRHEDWAPRVVVW